MKRGYICGAVLVLAFAGTVMAQQAAAPAAAPAPAPAAAAPAPSLTISRMEIAGSIENRQPAAIAASFPATQDKVYCYLELKDIAKDSTITYAWTFGQNETDKVTQPVRKASRWRTWGNKSIAGRKGDWKVDVLDETGAVLKSAAFKVE